MCVSLRSGKGTNVCGSFMAACGDLLDDVGCPSSLATNVGCTYVSRSLSLHTQPCRSAESRGLIQWRCALNDLSAALPCTLHMTCTPHSLSRPYVSLCVIAARPTRPRRSRASARVASWTPRQPSRPPSHARSPRYDHNNTRHTHTTPAHTSPVSVHTHVLTNAAR